MRDKNGKELTRVWKALIPWSGWSSSYQKMVLIMCVVFSVSSVSVGAQETATWIKAGTGDCPGRDIASSEGLTPDDKYAKAGYTAVCWDGSRYVHSSFPGKAACTYKNISPDQCKGGSNLGIMYRGAAAARTGWIQVGTGDCPGRDIASSEGFTPDEKYAKAGYTAVCWDGSRYVHSSFPGKAACTYKNLSSDQCTGGSNTGMMYKGAAAKSGWVQVGSGDCPGRDVGFSDGFTPDEKYAKAGYTAVCWDGNRYVHSGFPRKAGCTYKNISPDQCTGGSNPGVMYRGR